MKFLLKDTLLDSAEQIVLQHEKSLRMAVSLYGGFGESA
jgi:hypothetical protein